MTTLIDAGRIPEGTKIIFRPRSAREHQWVDPWLAGNPQRAEATWVNSRSKPLLWAYDGDAYSPEPPHHDDLGLRPDGRTTRSPFRVLRSGTRRMARHRSGTWPEAIQDEQYADDAEG